MEKNRTGHAPKNQETVKTVSGHIYGFSYLRAVACIAIIVLHVAYSAALMFGGSISQTQNIVSMIIVNCMMWAVPCFIMVTGALLLNKARKITYRKLFGQYILRVFGALVFFGMVFRIFDMVMDKEPISLLGFLKGFYEIFTGTGWSHLWYLYLLIGLYLLLPFYKKIAAHSGTNEMKYLLAVYLIFLSLLPLLQMGNVYTGFYIHVSTIYPFYLFCGYAVYSGIIKPGKALSAAMAVIGTVCIAVLTAVRWIGDYAVMEQLWGYSSIFVILQAVGIFSLFLDMKEEGFTFFKKILSRLDQCSFGVYLIHMLFVRLIIRYMQFNPYTNGGILAFIGLVLGVLLISWLVTWVLRKIPALKKIV